MEKVLLSWDLVSDTFIVMILSRFKTATDESMCTLSTGKPLSSQEQCCMMTNPCGMFV